MECFEFKGKKYLKNTIVRLNKDFVKSKCGQDCTTARACFQAGIYYLFALVDTVNPVTESEYTIFVRMDKIEELIEDIIEPYEPEVKRIKIEPEKYYDWDYTGLMQGWVIYIFFMCLFSIFKDVIGFWILTSVVFFNWRHNKLKPYRKNK